MATVREAINAEQVASIETSSMPKFSLARMLGNHRKCGEFVFARPTYPDNFIPEDKIIDIYPVYANSAENLIEDITSGKSAHIVYSGTDAIGEQLKLDKGQKITLDLSKTTEMPGTGNLGGNGRMFMVEDGSLTINGNGATLSVDNDSYGVFRVESDGKLEVNNAVLENVKKNGLNVKVLGGYAVLNNVEINSTTGGAIEVTEANLGEKSKPGYAVINNCKFTQQTFGDWCSTCVSVSGGSKLVINSGEFTSENYCIYVFSSGGVVEVNNGTFIATGDKECIKAMIDTATYPDYTGGVIIHGGSFTGTVSITEPAYLKIDGGSFSFDPTPYVDTTKCNITEKDGIYTVTKK